LFGFGASLTGGSPWTVTAPLQSPPQSQAPKKVPCPHLRSWKLTFKTFGFGAAAAGVSPFSAVSHSSSGWSGWDNQKPAVFEKKSLFAAAPTPAAATAEKPPLPPKKPAVAEEKKVHGSEDEEDDDSVSADENSGESKDEDGAGDFESQLVNGEEVENPKKPVDMRERKYNYHGLI